jgi:hypothetical protein
MRRRARRLYFESLEARQLLAGDPITGLGIAGDSLSDEYAVETYSYARNWNELLADERGVDLGPIGDYGEPRRMGYAYNWARAGATSQTLLDDEQHTELAAQINAGLVSHAVLSIGPNDFFPDFGSAYFNIAAEIWTPQQIQAYSDQVVANIETALATLAATDVLLVMSNIADYGVATLTRQAATAEQRERVTVVIDAINVRLEDMASTYGVPLVDINGVSRFFFGPNHAPIDSWEIGGVAITNTAGVGPTNAFVDDDIHPHTVVQSQIANLYLTAFNLAYETPVDLFSEEETLALEGLAYGGSDTLNLDYAAYVKLPASVGLLISDTPESINYFAGGSAALLAPAASVSGTAGLDFDGGVLIVSITAGAEAQDKLAVRNQGVGAGQIGVSGGQVLFGGAAIGTVAGGTGQTPLVVSLNAQADGAAIQALVRNLAFEHTAAGPVAAPRSVTLQLSDGSGTFSNTAGITVNVAAPQMGWTNVANPFDVDGDGVAGQIKDLLSVQFLRERGLNTPLPPPDAPLHAERPISHLLAVVQCARYSAASGCGGRKRNGFGRRSGAPCPATPGS